MAITGGTDTGVMKLVGDGLAKGGELALDKEERVTCIGVVPSGVCREVARAEDRGLSLTFDHIAKLVKTGRNIVVDPRQKLQNRQPTLNKNHTHLIFVEDQRMFVLKWGRHLAEDGAAIDKPSNIAGERSELCPRSWTSIGNVPMVLAQPDTGIQQPGGLGKSSSGINRSLYSDKVVLVRGKTEIDYTARHSPFLC